MQAASASRTVATPSIYRNPSITFLPLRISTKKRSPDPEKAGQHRQARLDRKGPAHLLLHARRGSERRRPGEIHGDERRDRRHREQQRQRRGRVQGSASPHHRDRREDPSRDPPFDRKSPPGKPGEKHRGHHRPGQDSGRERRHGGESPLPCGPEGEDPRSNTREQEQHDRRPTGGTQRSRDLDRRQDESIHRGENDPSHRRRRRHPRTEERTDVPGAHRSVHHREAAPLPDLVGGDSRRTELRKDETAVTHHFGKPRLRHPPDHLFGSEGPLPGGAPDVDPPGVEDQDPGVQSRPVAAHDVERQFIVGGDQDGRVPVRGPQRVQPRDDAVAVPADPPPNLPPAQEVAIPDPRMDAGNRAGRRLHLPVHERFLIAEYGLRRRSPAAARRRLPAWGGATPPALFLAHPLFLRHPFGSRSPIRGPSTPLTIVLSSSTLISERQHTFPSFSQPITASLSPPLIPALSRSSLGRTICPRSSTVTSDSTLQPPNAGVAQHGSPFACLFISASFTAISYYSE